MSKRRVLVTGCCGFIGRNIIERLAKRKDLEVYGTYFKTTPPSTLKKNSKIKLIRADLTKRSDVQKALENKDIIIQSADVTAGAQVALGNPLSLITDKVIMNSLIMEQSVNLGIKHLIFFSCTNMYPNQNKSVKESNFNREKIHPKYFGIGTTKVYLEDMCKFISEKGIKTTAIRHSNIYGPYDKYDPGRSHVFGATVTKVMTIKAGEDLVVWGDGLEKRDLLYIDDLVDFVEIIIDKQTDQNELLNLGLDQGITIKDLVKKMIKIADKKINIRYDTSKPMTNFSLVLNSNYARRKYNWKPKVNLDQGIKLTLDWYQKNIKY